MLRLGINGSFDDYAQFVRMLYTALQSVLFIMATINFLEFL